MTESYLNISHSINLLELIAAIVALIHFKKYTDSTERYFLHFLWGTFFIDTILGTLFDFLRINKAWVFYGYTGLSFLFYNWWYYTILKKKLYKTIVITLSAIFIILYIINSFNDGLKQYSFVIGASFMLIMAGFHLHELFISDYILNLKYKLSFWIATALLLFYIGMIPFMLLSKHFNLWAGNYTFFIILFFLNLCLYGCYIIGFIWTKKKYNHF